MGSFLFIFLWKNQVFIKRIEFFILNSLYFSFSRLKRVVMTCPRFLESNCKI
ncbi:hypothetical protein LEP1GSC151_5249 [Leptospira interrogans serovar Grippotyphosa str. LT2186]|uniref:Uncharacterized protein n=2 Tax=Leptospira interrogans TaxID=173 RepID=M3I6A3_LEPIR|nr:hypothetical protein LEP1GSC151_5249 [Leptospira interrogans serovar Grippotyphosa str. LT2186]EMY22738.1 hypothetical protein LEP1GSC115_2008 [Leptospira interrogans serovar Australis str. 200703203]